MASALSGSLASLTRARGASGLSGHLWMRLALISADKTAAALYDDLGQVRGGGEGSGPLESGAWCIRFSLRFSLFWKFPSTMACSVGNVQFLFVGMR